jgi:hypothetical protein
MILFKKIKIIFRSFKKRKKLDIENDVSYKYAKCKAKFSVLWDSIH